jgi:hypothetical protein
MRAKAIELKTDATVLESSFVMLPQRVDEVEFVADAGERWRQEVRHVVRRAQAYAHDARALARHLEAAAADLDHALTRYWKAEGDYEDERRKAATQPDRGT